MKSAGSRRWPIGHSLVAVAVFACCLPVYGAMGPITDQPQGSGAIASVDRSTTDRTWSCPGTNTPCNSYTQKDNSVNSDIADPAMSCAGGQSIGVLWFWFTATHDSVRVSTCNSLAPAWDSVFALYSGDCYNTLTEIACAEDTPRCPDSHPDNWNSYLDTGGLIVGDTYYIQFASWAAPYQGIYRLEIDCPCPDPPDPGGQARYGVEPENQHPVASIVAPYMGIINQPAYFDSSGSFDLDGQIVRYEWKWYSDDPAWHDEGPSPAHSYRAPSTYAVSLRVTDNDGSTGIATTTVRIVGHKPSDSTLDGLFPTGGFQSVPELP